VVVGLVGCKWMWYYCVEFYLAKLIIGQLMQVLHSQFSSVRFKSLLCGFHQSMKRSHLSVF